MQSYPLSAASRASQESAVVGGGEDGLGGVRGADHVGGGCEKRSGTWILVIVLCAVPHSDRVRLVAIAPAAVGEELFLEYGPDYWQGHYDSLPPPVQDEARAHYDLTVIEGTCYTPEQRRRALREGLIHRIGKRWFGGPSATKGRTRHPPAPPTYPRLPPPPLTTHGQPGRSRGTESTLTPALVFGPTPGTHHNSAQLARVPLATHGVPTVPGPDDPTSQPTLPGPPPASPRTATPAGPHGLPLAPSPLLAPTTPPVNPAQGPPSATAPDRVPTTPLRAPTVSDPVDPPPPPTNDGCPPHGDPGDTHPLDWLNLRGSIISGCVRLGWADSATTTQALNTVLHAGNAALGPLYALATLPHSPLAFRLWRATPGPPTPWFHEGAFDGIVMDYMMKTRASSGLRGPTHHGTLSLQDPSDLHLLEGHCLALGLLPPRPLGTTAAPSADYWAPVHHMTPQTLLQSQDPALPYTCFIAQGSEPPLQGPWGLCYSDSRLPNTAAFT